MCKTLTVKLCQVPLYKVSIETKRMVWYRQPLSSNTPAVLNLWNTNAKLYFTNNSNHENTSQVIYQIPSSNALNQFYENQLILEFQNVQGKVFGIARFDPRLFNKNQKQKKVMICPVLSIQDRNQFGCPIKLGDIQIKIGVSKAVGDIATLKKVKMYLDQLQQTRPCQLKKLYDSLKC